MLLGLMLACPPEPAGARIGETEQECAARYGEVVERRRGGLEASDELVSVFRAGSFVVVVEFKDGRAWRVDYRKPLIDQVDIDQVLDWHKIAEGWGRPLQVFGDRFWLRPDREVLVRTLRGEGGSSVVVMNRAHLEANAAHRRQQIQEIVGPEIPLPEAPESLLP